MAKDGVVATEAVTLDQIFPQGQIRLAEISVSNWGTFSGGTVHTARIDPGGTLITGHTGAGKTTFVDAHQVLLMSAGSARFNVAAAQEDKRDRSLMTYVRGRFGTEQDSNGRGAARYKRPKDALSGVRALYRTEAGSEYTLAALFWAGQETDRAADIKRVYVVSRRNLSLKDLLNKIRENGTGSPRPSSLVAAFAEDQAVKVIPDRFEAYAVHARKLLYIDNDNAPALLARAMGLKRIDNLTELVRSLVLEEPDTRDKALAAIAEFDDLRAIHSALDSASRQEQLLRRLPEHQRTLSETHALKRSIGLQLAALRPWYAQQRVSLLNALIAELGRKIKQADEDLSALEVAITSARKVTDDAKRAYDDAGGSSLDQQQSLKSQLVTEVATATDKKRYFTGLLKQAGVPSPEIWGAEQFRAVRDAAQAAGRQAEKESTELEPSYKDAIVNHSKLREELRSLVEEVRAMERRPDSLIPPHYQELRGQVCEHLEVDPAEIPFVGELIDVKDSEAAWRGAIERVVGFKKLRLVVAPELEREALRFVKSRHLGMKVGIEVPKKDVDMVAFKPASFCHKLEWRQHRYREWVKYFIAEGTYDCVATVEEMQARPFSMTVEGLVHGRKGSFDKDDSKRIDDEREWIIGFSNAAKKERLLVRVRKQSDEVSAANTHVDSFKTRREELLGRTDAGRRIGELSWEAVDVEGLTQKLRSTEDRIAEILCSGADLEKAEAEWKRCAAEEEKLRREQTGCVGRRSADVQTLEDRKIYLISEQEKAIAIVIEAEIVSAMGEQFPQMTLDVLRQEIQLNRAATEDQASEQLRGRQRAAVDGFSSTDKAASLVMNSYTRDFRSEAADLQTPSGSDSDEIKLSLLAEWVVHYRKLVDSQLPELKGRFETSLTTHATQSMTIIGQTIRIQAEEIDERIESINRVLAETDVRPGAYLALSPVSLVTESITRFNKELEAVTRMAIADPEQHFKAISTFVATLQKATDPNTRGSLESQSMMDARFRCEFAANVIDRETKTSIDYMRNTSGKSGGEKESFAGSIVAAALNYVLTPYGARKPAYCTVFLDEAFANTSDGVAQRVLNVFKKLGLHVNLITPFKNVQLVRDVVKRAVIVSVDGDFNSRLTEATWEEVDRQLIAKSSDLTLHAQALGIRFSADDQASP